jgi:alpha-L-fucosidase 2
MCEMLLQSHLGELHLLPALPDAWQQGSIKGLKARGDFEVSMSWKNKVLTNAVITSLAGGICIIRTGIPVSVKGVVVAKSVADVNGYVTTFNTVKGKVYSIVPIGKK